MKDISDHLETNLSSSTSTVFLHSILLRAYLSPSSPLLAPLQVIFKVSAGERPPLPSADAVPAPLIALMQQCWAEDAAQRPTFAQVLDALAVIDARDPTWPPYPPLPRRQ